MFLDKDKVPWWRSGHWSGIPTLKDNKLFNITFLDNENKFTTIWSVPYPIVLSTLLLNESGFIRQFLYYKDIDYQWNMLGAAPFDVCDTYKKCGAFGKCNIVEKKFECSCLLGF